MSATWPNMWRPTVACWHKPLAFPRFICSRCTAGTSSTWTGKHPTGPWPMLVGPISPAWPAPSWWPIVCPCCSPTPLALGWPRRTPVGVAWPEWAGKGYWKPQWRVAWHPVPSRGCGRVICKFGWGPALVPRLSRWGPRCAMHFVKPIPKRPVLYPALRGPFARGSARAGALEAAAFRCQGPVWQRQLTKVVHLHPRISLFLAPT